MLYQTGIFIRLLIILDNDSIQYGDKLSNDKKSLKGDNKLN